MEVKPRCSQTQLIARWLGAEMLSVAGEGARRGCSHCSSERCPCNCCKTNAESCQAAVFDDFRKSKSSLQVSWLAKTGTNIGLSYKQTLAKWEISVFHSSLGPVPGCSLALV